MYSPITCAHETAGTSVEVELDDYYPLTSDEVRELLTEALTSANPAGQQVRLGQAIPGMTCPRPIDDPVANRLARVESLFVDGLRAGEFDVAAIIALTRRGG